MDRAGRVGLPGVTDDYPPTICKKKLQKQASLFNGVDSADPIDWNVSGYEKSCHLSNRLRWWAHTDDSVEPEAQTVMLVS